MYSERHLDALLALLRALDLSQHPERGMGGAAGGVLHRLQPEHRYESDRSQRLDPGTEALQLLDELMQGRCQLEDRRVGPRAQRGRDRRNHSTLPAERNRWDDGRGGMPARMERIVDRPPARAGRRGSTRVVPSPRDMEPELP